MDVLRPQRNRRGSSIGALATLPVFLDLKDKPVLIAGGGDGAAWKAELLAACGAEVHVFAPIGELSPAFRDLLDQPAFVHHDCHWEAAYFKHFALAVGECEPHEAKAFHDRAREAGVPVNVIDQPEFCQFKFGSIVNRSPLVIGISTDGAAPILAQAVRRRIEAALPRTLSAWAGLARDIRDHVSAMLEAPAQRRTFWERFVDRAFGERTPGAQEASELAFEARQIATAGTPRATSVAFIDAGHDDPELLTLKAMRALQSADVIVFDGSIPGAVLELGRREAKRMEAPADLLQFTGRRVVRLHDGSLAAHHQVARELATLARNGVEATVLHSVSRIDPVAADRRFHLAAARSRDLNQLQHRGHA
ncbi:NAD(P)-dependent oxidoreductase [Rhizobium sp. LjRoot254]|uniref:NAD(P)-dependent oxidoreductase n=1 Tax=Rhizobium sp. LjRoot254 TaxID=3342297 RepID=UPI003ED054D1